MAVPKLRFKDDQGREFPDWENKKIGYYLQEKNIKMAETSTIPLMAFVANKGIVPKGARYDRSALIKTENKQYKRTDYGDFIYSSNNLDVGSIGLNLYGSAVISPVYEIFSSKEDVNLACLNMLLQRPRSLYKILRYRQGVTYGQLRIHPKDFLNITLCFPTIPEQRKIADFLSSYDALIDNQSKRVETLRKRKLGLLQKVFSRELRFRDNRGNEFPDWEEKRLGILFSKINKRNHNKSISNVITNSAVYGLVEQRTFFDKDIANKENTDKYYVIENGDFVYNPRKSNDAPYGPIHMYEGKDTGIVSPLYLCLKPSKKDMCLSFMKHYFHSNVWHKFIYENGDTGARDDRVSIKVQTLLDMPVFLPSLPEQRKIADFFVAVDEQIEIAEKKLETMRNIKKGLLQQLFV